MKNGKVMTKEEEEYRERCDNLVSQTVAVDFDGVIHPTGGSYLCPDGDPLPGARDALEALSSRYSNIVIHTCRALEDRPVNCVPYLWEWLEKHGMKEYVSEVTSIKPRAAFYIDDKAVRHEGCWETTLGTVGLWLETDDRQEEQG